MDSTAILLGSVFVIGLGAVIAAVSAFRKHERIEAAMAAVQQRFAQGAVTPYQAACFTSVPAVEVAVWLLLERGDVLVSRDGRVHKALSHRRAAPIGRDEDERGTSGRDAGAQEPHDAFQATVLTALASAPDGLKLHELAAWPTCAQASVQAQDFGVPELHCLDGGSVTAIKALQWLRAQSEHLLAARFVALDHDQERRALALFRTRTPLHFPPGTPTHIVDFARNRAEHGADASFAMLMSSSTNAGSASSCGGGFGCGGGGASCGGGGGGCGGGGGTC